MNVHEKKEILAKIENCSKREAQEILANYFSADVISKNKSKESVRILCGDEASLHIRLTTETLKKLDRIKNLRAHKNPGMGYGELIEDMCQFVLKKIDPSLRPTTTRIGSAKSIERKSAQPRYIPEKIKSEIYKRDHSQCSFVDKQTGRKCTSKYLLQIDHIQPVSRGGKCAVSNLQLLCQAHHKFRDQYV
ncbi:MAG: HNH endonuclease signature motif containing protein [Bdellovibrionota bacterium]